MEAMLCGASGQVLLRASKITVGRARDNQLVVDDSQVSHYHAEICAEGQGYSITDLGSRNGTFVNEYPLTPNVARSLHPFDRLRFGRNANNPGTIFTYEIRGATPLEPTRVAPPPPPQQGYQHRLSQVSPATPPPPHLNYRPPQPSNSKIGDEKEGKWSWRDWVVKVIIPILGILATAGFFTAKAVTSGPSIPQLHQTYSGHVTGVGISEGLFITGMNENSVGDFTATGTDSTTTLSCPITLDNGKVSTDSTISFELQNTLEETSLGPRCGLALEFKGTIRSDGSMIGTWNVPNTQIQGAWDLS